MLKDESAKNNDTVWRIDVLTLQKINNQKRKIKHYFNNEENLLLPNSTLQYQFLR